MTIHNTSRTQALLASHARQDRNAPQEARDRTAAADIGNDRMIMAHPGRDNGGEAHAAERLAR